jgi:hypothetical protein
MSVNHNEPRQAPANSDSPPVAALRRWEDMGGIWRVVSRTSDDVTVVLLRCDGGEEVDRLVSDDPRLLTFLDSSPGNDA